MGEIICRICKEMNWHIDCHATGKCKYCNAEVNYCDSCLVSIPKGGDEFGKKLIEDYREHIDKDKLNKNDKIKMYKIK